MIGYLKSVYSSGDCASFSRWATTVTVLTSCGCLLLVVFKTHALPDATSLGGLSVFATAPYGIGKLAQVYGSRQTANNATGPISASADPDGGRGISRLTLDRAFLFLLLLLFCVWLHNLR